MGGHYEKKPLHLASFKFTALMKFVIILEYFIAMPEHADRQTCDPQVKGHLKRVLPVTCSGV